MTHFVDSEGLHHERAAARFIMDTRAAVSVSLLHDRTDDDDDD